MHPSRSSGIEGKWGSYIVGPIKKSNVASTTGLDSGKLLLMAPTD
jgi:hypothetical protein